MSATTTRLAALASQLSSPLAPNPASTAASLARRRKRMAQEQAEADGGDDQPLKGVTVVEMAMVIAAPQACALMADMGARVIKVEPPKGEITRNEGLRDGVDKRGEPFTAHFETLNRGKESMVLDIKNEPSHLAALKKLLSTADVFVTNLRDPALAKDGLDYDTLSKELPNLIYCHFTAWGRQGPKRNDPGYDVAAFWAATGMQYHARPDDDSDLPRFVGGIGDMTTCRDLVMGVTAALYRREKTGKGSLVDACLLRSGMFSAQLVMEPAPGRTVHWNVTYNAFKCKDNKWIQMLGLESARHLPGFLAALGLEDSGIKRAVGPEEVAMIDAVFAQKDRAEWEEIFKAQDVWHQPVLSAAEAVRSEQPRAVGAFVDIPGVGKPLLANPVKFGDPAKATIPGRASELGAHTQAILEELGMEERPSE